MAKNKDTYFHLFSDCVTVKGFTQSIIIDYNQQSCFFIPNDLNDILSALNKHEIKTVKAKLNNKFDSELDNFCNTLINQNKGFYSQTKSNFPPLNKVWVVPYKITNIIIDINNSLSYNALMNFEIDCLGVNIYEYSTNTINELNLITEKIR